MVHQIVTLAFALAAVAGSAAAQHVHPTSDDAGVAAPSGLTPEQMRQLREGDGMGLARPAELNAYPGPKHVLELADALDLSEGQRREVAAVRAVMLADAQRLGAAIIERERSLDEMFRERAATPPGVTSRVSEIAALHGELRSVHLAAHLAVTALLTPEQIRRYVALRGHGHPHP